MWEGLELSAGCTQRMLRMDEQIEALRPARDVLLRE